MVIRVIREIRGLLCSDLGAHTPVFEPGMNATVVTRTCPVCDRQETQEYLTKSQLHLVQCRHCSMIYANPIPAEFASGEFYDRAGQEYYLTPAKLESDYAPVRFSRELRVFRGHCDRGLVLDVGCSTGAFLFQLNQRFPGCYETIGTDVSGPALDHAESRGITVLRSNFLDVDCRTKRFDAITFWAVLEHLAEPKRFLERASSLLRPSGLCFVLVPNMQSLAVRWLSARYRYIYPQHLNYFTRATLAQLCSPWFTIIERRTTHFNPLVVWQDWRHVGAEVSNRERADLLKRTTAYKQSLWLAPVKAGYGLLESGLSKLNLADNLLFVLRKS